MSHPDSDPLLGLDISTIRQRVNGQERGILVIRLSWSHFTSYKQNLIIIISLLSLDSTDVLKI